MLGDPHSRSTHRASPAAGLVGGLASLNPQALVRQAQAGQARARQAIVRQAMARQARGNQAPAQRSRDRHRPLPNPQPPTPAHQQPRGSAPAQQQPGCLAPPAQQQPGWLAPARQPGWLAPANQRNGWPALSRKLTDLSAMADERIGRSAPDHEPADPSALDHRPTDPPLAHGSALDPWSAVDDEPDGLPALGLQAVVRLAAEFQAAERLRLEGLEPRRPAAAHHRQPRGGRRPAIPGRQRREPQQALQSPMRGLAALIVLAIVGLSTFFILAESLRAPDRDSPAPGAAPAIASRAVDAKPLTQDEVFPELAVQLGTGAANYQVTMTHSDSECGTATSGELGTLLRDHGCDQVVRARLTAPYGGYQVTAGVFNLADAGGAAQVSELTGALVETGRGTFATLGGAVGDPLAEPLAQVAWHSRGHYLLYTVVARPDGHLVADEDPYAARITAELVGRYLGQRVIGQREQTVGES